jgi:Fe-S oxidoreductase
MLERAGARTTWLDSGCCGMAGSFGFNPNHAELSRDVAELVLAPEVRKQPEGTVILTNGFSCREQVKHMTGRTAMHLAQVLAMGLPRRVVATERLQQSEGASPSTIENVV